MLLLNLAGIEDNVSNGAVGEMERSVVADSIELDGESMAKTVVDCNVVAVEEGRFAVRQTKSGVLTSRSDNKMRQVDRIRRRSIKEYLVFENRAV